MVILIMGMTVLLIGIAMIILPGPALVVIPVGLAILATEFAWARRWLNVMRNSAEKGAEKLNLRSLFRPRGDAEDAEKKKSPRVPPRAMARH